jgi:quinol monooxygenase YgiN
MGSVGILARLEAKPGRESDLEKLLTGALPLAEAEPGTQTWFAWRMGTSTFGIFDTFQVEEGRQAHLNGEIAKALMANADELLAQPPDIQPIDLLAEKLPG